jgi:ribose 5-phosphate isomerase B
MKINPKEVIAIASDHAGFALKQLVEEQIKSYGLNVLDLGALDESSVDYPVYGGKLALAIVAEEAVRGVGICGTGIGMSIVLNRVPGVRAALCHNSDTAELARRHNDANVLVLGSRIMDEGTSISCLKAFLETGFDGGRHALRVAMIDHIKEGSIE